MPDVVEISWGYGSIAAVGMGLGTVLGSQRMTTTAGASTLNTLPAALSGSTKCLKSMLWGLRKPAHDHKTMHAVGWPQFEHQLMRTLVPGAALLQMP